MKVFLIVVFFVQGKPMFLDGWMPLPMESEEKCEQARQIFQSRVEDMSPYEFHLRCYKSLPPGSPA